MVVRVVVVVALLLSACSSTPEAVEIANAQRPGDELPPPSTEPSVTTVAPADAPSPVEAPPKSQSPRAAPPTSTARSIQSLDPESALIGDAAIEGWSIGRSYDHGGYVPIESQTDCESFNLFETRNEFDGAARSGSADRADVHHAIYDAGAVGPKLQTAAGRIVRDCPRMAWLEGGDATNEYPLMTLPDGWVAFRQTDDFSDVVMWSASASRDNLLSVLTYHTWGDASGGGAATFGELVDLADRALREARPAQAVGAAPPSPTTTYPSDPPVTSPPTTTTVVDAGWLEPLLITSADVGAPVELEGDLSIDPSEFARCEHADAFSDYFAQFEVGATATRIDPTLLIMQAVGSLDQPEATTTTMRELDELGSCAFDDEWVSEITFSRPSAPPEPIVDAAVISYIDTSFYRDEPLRMELLFVELEDAVMFVALTEHSGLTVEDMLDLIAAKATD